VKYKINYKDVLKSVVQGIIVINLEGCLIDVNDEFADLLGYTKNELIGKHIVEISPFNIPKYFNEDSAPIKMKLELFGSVQNHETQYLKKDRTVIFAEVNISSLKDDENKLIGYVTAVRFIMDRKSRELKLRESEDLLRKIIFIDPNYIFVKDRDGKYVLANKHIADYFKITTAAMIGKTNFDLVRDGKMTIQNAEAIKKVELEVLNTGKEVFLANQTIKQLDGSVKWFQTTKIPLNQGGVSDFVLTVAVDVTELKINFDLLKEKEAELTTKNKALNEFNTTLEVLIRQKDNDRLELEKKILSTMKLLIDPYLGKLDRLCSKPVNKNLIETIKTNLKEIISPFTLKLSSGYINLSSSEIQVADFIKKGLRNKEIAEIKNISTETVAVHRKNIRKKMGINNTKTNLNTYLKTLM
jgi:PAS domain S-box-containing protein